MKRGDKVPVTIAGQRVADAEVRELGDGTVTLVVPGTLVVMATRTEISNPEPVQREAETLITGVDRTSGDNSESAAVSDNQQTQDVSTSEGVTDANSQSAPVGGVEPATTGGAAPDATDTTTAQDVQSAPVSVESSESTTPSTSPETNTP